MKYVEAAGLRLSAIGVGTWQFGAGEWGYGSNYAEEVAPAIIERSLDLGVNLVDTAEAYAFGRSERIVGKAIADRRDDVFVATKLFPILPFDPVVSNRAHGSARRLGVEEIDLYQVHWPNPVVPVKATMRALAALQREGLVRNVGVSNFSRDKWAEAEADLKGPVVSNQVRYSLVHREPEEEILPYAQANDRIVIAYSPLGQGLLSGRYDADHLPSRMRATSSAFLPENLAAATPLLDALKEVAASHGATNTQIALAWLIRRKNVVVIPGASSVAQAEANAAAADIELSDDEDARLVEASDRYAPIAGFSAMTRLAQMRAERAASRVRRAVGGLGA